MPELVMLVLGGLALGTSSASAEAVIIEHQPVACASADKFPRLEARLAPAEAVGAARVVFQGQTADWYSVAMRAEGAVYAGVLPRPKMDLKSFRYYIEVTDKALGTTRTADFTASVVDSAAACQGKVMAGALGSASVILQGSAGVAAIPAGFASAGVVAGSAAGAGTTGAAGAAAAGGGGLSTGAIVGVAAGVGGAAAIGVAVASGGDSERGSSESLTGQWVGTWRDSDPTPLCGTLAFNTTLTLTQNGNSLSGTMNNVLTTVPPPTSSGCAATGTSFSGPVTSGQASGTSVQFVASLTSVSPTRTFTFTGSASGTRPGSVLSGTYVTTVAEFPQFQARGALSATKQ